MKAGIFVYKKYFSKIFTPVNKAAKEEKGLTLVEILVGLILLVMVLGLTYSFYFFGTRSFNVGESRTDVQQNVRFIADHLSKNLRFADSAEILGDSITFDINYNYIYLDGTSIKYRLKGETTSSELFPDISGNIDFSLNLKKSTSGNNILFFRIDGTDGQRDYYIDSELQLPNISSITINTASGATADGGTGIAFLNPKPPEPVVKNMIIDPETLPQGGGSISVVVHTLFVPNGTTGSGRIYEVIPPASEEGEPTERNLDNTTFYVNGNSASFVLYIGSGEPAGHYKIEADIDGIHYPYINTYIIEP